MDSSMWPARHSQLATPKLPLPTHCCQVITGQLNTDNLPWGQLAAASQKESQVDGWASEQLGGQNM